MQVSRFECLESRRVLSSLSFDAHDIGVLDTPLTVFASDLNEDGDSDLVVSTSSVSESSIQLYENKDGLGTFGLPHLVDEASLGVVVDGGDIDNDGDIDLIAGWNSIFVGGEVRWYANNGRGEFGEKQQIGIAGVGGGADYLATVDLDLDGDLDVISSFGYPNVNRFWRSQIAWHENIDGAGHFETRIVDVQASTELVAVTTTVFPVDVDQDGDLDLLTNQKWLENDGAQQFEKQYMIDVVERNFRASAGDIDLDGDIDLLVQRNTGLAWFPNTDERGEFGSRIDITGEVATSIKLADLDNDDDLDLVFGKRDGRVQWWINDDGRGFFEFTGQINGLPIPYLEASDVNGDGDMDIVAASRESGKIVWLDNQLNGIPGDSNRDGRFNSADLVTVFQAGEYEDDIEGNSTFEEGDWSGDGDFNSSDLVFAFKAGNYVFETTFDRARAADLIFAIDKDEKRQLRIVEDETESWLP